MNCIDAFSIIIILIILWYCLKLIPIGDQKYKKVHGSDDTFSYFDGEKNESCYILPCEYMVERKLSPAAALRNWFTGQSAPLEHPRHKSVQRGDIIRYSNETAEPMVTPIISNANSLINMEPDTTLVVDDIPIGVDSNYNWGVDKNTQPTSWYPTIPSISSGLEAFASDNDQEFWDGREKVGAVSAQCGNKRRVKQDKLVTKPTFSEPCHIPSDNQVFKILYNYAIELPNIDDGPAQDDCELHETWNNYTYKEPCENLAQWTKFL